MRDPAEDGLHAQANDNEQVFTVQALTMPQVRSVVRRGTIFTITFANGAEHRCTEAWCEENLRPFYPVWPVATDAEPEPLPHSPKVPWLPRLMKPFAKLARRFRRLAGGGATGRCHRVDLT
jgi:hypothetical protein